MACWPLAGPCAVSATANAASAVDRTFWEVVRGGGGLPHVGKEVAWDFEMSSVLTASRKQDLSVLMRWEDPWVAIAGESWWDRRFPAAPAGAIVFGHQAKTSTRL